MSSSKTQVIDIPRNKTSSNIQKILHKTIEWKLDVNTFDPSKNSPPNQWLQKLEARVQEYYTQEQIRDNQ